MALPDRLRFGIFMAPFHEPGQNPTWTLERDLELIQWLDQLGFDEAGLASITAQAGNTFQRRISLSPRRLNGPSTSKLGTGVVSLPYHHPLMVADRMVLLDHLTRGRVLLGIGRGVLVSDALTLGINPTLLRSRMEEAFDVIMRLFTETEPITVKSDWFELANGALQLRPYTQPHTPIAVASIQS